LVADANHPCGNTNRCRVIRDIIDDYGICANAHIVADANIADDAGASADVDIITKNWSPAFVGANGDPVFDGDVAAALDARIDDQADAVEDDETGSELSAPTDDGVGKDWVKLVQNGANQPEMMPVTEL